MLVRVANSLRLHASACRPAGGVLLPRASVWNESIDAREAAKADSFYDSTVEKYAQQPLEILSLRQMLHFGEGAWAQPEKVLKSAQYVQRELPKRLARRLLDLQLLPYIVVTNPHIKRVYLSYRHAFEALRQLPPIATLEDNTAFTHLLHRLVDEHAPMLDALATGLRECRARPMVGPALRLDPFLDGMLRSRISRRVIAEQHLHIANHRPGYVGVVCTDLQLRDAVEFAAQRMTQPQNLPAGVHGDVRRGARGGDRGAAGGFAALHPHPPGLHALRAPQELRTCGGGASRPQACHCPPAHQGKLVRRDTRLHGAGGRPGWRHPSPPAAPRLQLRLDDHPPPLLPGASRELERPSGGGAGASGGWGRGQRQVAHGGPGLWAAHEPPVRPLLWGRPEPAVNPGVWRGRLPDAAAAGAAGVAGGGGGGAPHRPLLAGQAIVVLGQLPLAMQQPERQEVEEGGWQEAPHQPVIAAQAAAMVAQ